MVTIMTKRKFNSLLKAAYVKGAKAERNHSLPFIRRMARGNVDTAIKIIQSSRR